MTVRWRGWARTGHANKSAPTGVRKSDGLEASSDRRGEETSGRCAGDVARAVLVERLWLRVTRVVASMVFAALTNLARGQFPTGWAYANGPDAFNGSVHD